MRNISFKLTTRQFLDGSKAVTRRLGWEGLETGTKLMGVKQAQGIKKGEMERFGAIEVVDIRRERLDRMKTDVLYGFKECIREGFPEMEPSEFVAMFCENMKVEPSQLVTRIQFKHVDLHQDKMACPNCFAMFARFVRLRGFQWRDDEVACPRCDATFIEEVMEMTGFLPV